MKTILFTLSALCAVTCTYAQTADEIITKHIEALGGKDKIAQIKTMYAESTTEVMGGESPSKTIIVEGKAFRSLSEFNGQSIIQVVTDKDGWGINPFSGPASAIAMTEEEFKLSADQVYVLDPLINYADHGAKAEFLGQEKLSDVNTYKIKYTNKYGTSITYYIDAATFYIIQSTQEVMMMGQTTNISIAYSNYQKTDFGVTAAHTMSMDLGQFSLLINTSKIEFNKEVDMTVFDMPK